MDFTAIDFETANERRDSACQLGAVVVRGGDIVRRHCWMIRPPSLRFSPRNIAIHGITPDHVRDEANFGQLWNSIREVLAGQILVAHNARFDIGVLRACMDRYGFEVADFQFSCTRAIGRSAWPGQGSYALKAIANRLGFTFNHHDALEDAIACAKILIAAADHHEVASLEALEKKLRITRGRAGAWGCGGPRSIDQRPRSYGQRRSWSPRGVESEPRVYQQRLRLRDVSLGSGAAVAAPLTSVDGRIERAADQRAWLGKTVVFTGLLHHLDRDHAERLVAAAGGVVCGSVTRQTDVLVVGEPDARTRRAGRMRSTKEERAEQLRSAGQMIEVLTEQEFLAASGYCL